MTLKRLASVVAVVDVAAPRPAAACDCIDVGGLTAQQRDASFKAEYESAVAVFLGRAIDADP